MRPATVLITDAEQRSALAVVRSLGRVGHRVYVCSHQPYPLASASRWARQSTRVADPLTSPHRFAAEVAECCRRWSVDVLIPVGEASALAVLRERDHFADVVVPLPPLEVFERICDKAGVAGVAEEIGIAVPRQSVLPDRAAAAAAAADLTYPLVLKPSKSVGEAGGVRMKVGVSYAEDHQAFVTLLERLPDQAFPLLAQHRVDGPGIGVFLLRWGGAPLAVFSHRRIREKPPSGGVSVYRESTRADPELVRLSDELLARFDWEGVAMVEYKLESRTGTPYLMEINGRFWGSLQLAIDAGVDFPVLLVRAARGLDVPAVNEYRTGVRSRWWLGDLDHLLLRLAKSDEDLALPASASSRTRAALEFLRLWWPGDRSEIFRFGDPYPALREARSWVRDLRSFFGTPRADTQVDLSVRSSNIPPTDSVPSEDAQS